MPKRVLILCTGNSCRSQMAEALWESLGGGSWQSESAGSKPSGYVHPLAIQAMQEMNIDISEHQSKSLDQFQNQPFDLVVTVCDNAKESCPVFPGAKTTLHWPFQDPADATGSEEEQMTVFRRIRDEIKDKIETYLQTLKSEGESK
ncbi:arsenate reductase ArsC [Symmachiella dynata]|uniref:arsenate reductase ArsC n=1 Tax=Symmachiella dynata TaxID=2527995 RepID=UPI0030EEF7C7